MEITKVIQLVQERPRYAASHSHSNGLNPDSPLKKGFLGTLPQVEKGWQHITTIPCSMGSEEIEAVQRAKQSYNVPH